MVSEFATPSAPDMAVDTDDDKSMEDYIMSTFDEVLLGSEEREKVSNLGPKYKYGCWVYRHLIKTSPTKAACVHCFNETGEFNELPFRRFCKDT